MEATSKNGAAKPALAEPVMCPGGVYIKPPFEMGVGNFEVFVFLYHQFDPIKGTEDFASDGQPNYDFMEGYMKRIEADILRDYVRLRQEKPEKK